ncbi:hypothetical protein K8I28_08655 [bacterium]|nr:hypothetical protein [bacterium]
MKKLLFNSRSKNSYVQIFYLFILFVLLQIPADSLARFPFEEGDWIAWGDSRYIYDMEIGKRTVYFATNAGILRWDRLNRNWVYRWYSVPGPLNRAFLLKNCRAIIEDPVNSDVYVRAGGKWYRRMIGTERWEERNPSEQLLQQQEAKKQQKINPQQNLINHDFYSVGTNFELQFRNLSWEFAMGMDDNRGRHFFAWNGYGIGIADATTSMLELYPMGPGAAMTMDVVGDEIWCASRLDHEFGWVWHRDRNASKWTFDHPQIEWGLEPANANRMKIGPDGTIWLATDQGVSYKRGNSWHQLRKQDGLPRSHVNDIAPVEGGAWIATDFGLAEIDASNGLIIRPDKRSENLAYRGTFTAITSYNGTVWAVGAGVLMQYTPEMGWQELKGPSTIGGATRPNVISATEGVLAIGDRLGFAFFEKKRGWTQILSNRWEDGQVEAIDFHEGYYWLGTDRGLVKYDPVDKDVVMYKREDGLPGSMVTEIIGEGGWLWLGTDQALVRFHWDVEGRID